MKEFKVLAFSVRGKDYTPGVLKIEVERSEGELLHWKKSFRKEKLVSITKFTYDAKTDLQAKGTTLQVADISIHAESENATSEISQLLLTPLKQAYEKSLIELKGPLRGFLIIRAEALGTVDYLESDPRSSVVRNRTLIAADATDPVKALLDALTGQIREQLRKVEGVLSAAPERVRARLAETVYALACALSAVQDAGLYNDAEGGRAAAVLIFAITQLKFAPGVIDTDGSASAARGPMNTEVAGLFLDGVLASLRDKMLEKAVR